MPRQKLWAGTLGMVLVGLAAGSVAVAPSFGSEALVAARTTSLPPEFSGYVTLTFDVSASESTSDLAPGHYDQSHLFGSVTLHPRDGAVSAIFDGNLFSATPSLDVKYSMIRYAPHDPCQDNVLKYTPASGYPGYPAYFGMETPETALIWGYRWGIDMGPIVAAQSNGCPGSDGNWPITKFDELVRPFLQGVVHDTDLTGGRMHLVGTKTVDLTSRAVVHHNKAACASDGVYYDPCITSLTITMAYDLQRISPDRTASQYPRLILRNDKLGNDKVEVRTDTAVKDTKVVVYEFTPGHLVMQSVGSPTTNRKGIVRFTLRDRHRSERRWFIAYVEGTSRVLAGVSPSDSIR